METIEHVVQSETLTPLAGGSSSAVAPPRHIADSDTQPTVRSPQDESVPRHHGRHHAFALAAAAGLVVGALLYAGFRIHWQNQEIDSLRQQAGEAADGKRKGEQLEDRLRDEQSRREKLESTLETLRQEVANTRDNAQGREAELRKALGFLREELKAAEAVIERLKAESAAKGNPSANTGSASPSTSPR